MKGITDKDLFLKVSRGNRNAFETLFNKYYYLLCDYSERMVNDKDIAEEIVQDFFVNLWVKREDILITSSLKSYFYGSIHNRTLNYIKSLKLRDEYREEKERQLKLRYKLPVLDQMPLSRLVVNDIEKDFKNALSTLPEQCREVFHLCRFEDMSYTEVGKELNISVNSVKTQMKRALSKLREQLKHHLNDS